MNNKILIVIICVVSFITVTQISSCSKSSPNPATPPVSDVCAGKTITITATPAASNGCGATGSVVVSASGSTGFTYKLNSAGNYQASGTFSNLAAATYTVFAKDATGCEKSQSVTVETGGTAGPKFTLVKNLLVAKCNSCHNAANSQGGMNWSIDCNIVQFQTRIKVRAVDLGDMPQGGPSLTAGEKAVITDWISAGGLLNN